MNRAATVALAPLSGLYGLAMKARRALYQSGLARVRKVGVPVISVGNITMGGTGKTPLVEWIANELSGRNLRVCILTRGYRRSSVNRVLVSNGRQILSNAERAGDEAFLLAERLEGQAAVISDADRASAARWAVENLKSEVFILDDGFQNRGVARNLNIVTVDATNPWGNRRLLPAGILREPLSELTRADCIVITRADDPIQTTELRSEIHELSGTSPIFSSQMEIIGLRPLHGDREAGQTLNADSELKSGSVAAFCGIGNPESFFAELSRDGYKLSHKQSFPDHHYYTQPQVDAVVKEAKSHGAKALLTTAKDEVKLRSLSFEIPCYAVDITIDVDGAENLRALIEEAVRIPRHSI